MLPKSNSESFILLFEKSFKKEMLKYIDQRVEDVLNQRLNLDVQSKTVLNSNEVCQKYRISKSTLERAVRKEGLKYNSQSKGKKRLFKQKDLDNWFENKNTNRQKT